MTEDEWKEGSFAIPKVGDVAGIGGAVSRCEQDYAATLEFRADGDYSKISLKAAPGKDTDDSSKTLIVGLYNNTDFIDSIKVPYGRVGRFKDKDISNVSALKIKVWTQATRCGSTDVFAVLYDINVST